jgi:hypothetical protein
MAGWTAGNAAHAVAQPLFMSDFVSLAGISVSAQWPPAAVISAALMFAIAIPPPPAMASGANNNRIAAKKVERSRNRMAGEVEPWRRSCKALARQCGGDRGPDCPTIEGLAARKEA